MSALNNKFLDPTHITAMFIMAVMWVVNLLQIFKYQSIVHSAPAP